MLWVPQITKLSQAVEAFPNWNRSAKLIAPETFTTRLCKTGFLVLVNLSVNNWLLIRFGASKKYIIKRNCFQELTLFTRKF